MDICFEYTSNKETSFYSIIKGTMIQQVTFLLILYEYKATYELIKKNSTEISNEKDECVCVCVYIYSHNSFFFLNLHNL